MVILKQAKLSDLDTIESLQRQSFKVWYDKYQDHGNPYIEPRERIEKKYHRPNSFYYLIEHAEQTVGFLRILLDEKQEDCWLGSVAILPAFQRKGLATKAIMKLERLYPDVNRWTLCTIFQEKGLVSLYERCGYRQSHIEKEQAGMDLVYMEKQILSNGKDSNSYQ